MFVCSYNVKLNKFDSSRFNVRPIPGYNIDVNRVSDIFFANILFLQIVPGDSNISLISVCDLNCYRKKKKNGVAGTRVFYHPAWLDFFCQF